MDEGISRILLCVERGKVDAASPYPPDLRGQDGAEELTRQALIAGAGPDEILAACDEGMRRIGDKFGAGKAFVPELLMSSKAMKAAMAHLKPFFASGQVRTKGVFVVGTVAGDLHDIGKNLVAMVAEGEVGRLSISASMPAPGNFLTLSRPIPAAWWGFPPCSRRRWRIWKKRSAKSRRSILPALSWWAALP